MFGNAMIRIILTIYLFIGTVLSANETRWIQLETLPSIVRAKEATSRLSTSLNEKVNIFFLDDGWYAISLGPYDSVEAFEVLNTKLSANLISSDSFVTDGRNYGKKVWTAASFSMADLENLAGDENAEQYQNYDFDLNENLLNKSESENLLFSSIEGLDSLEKAKFFDAQLSDFYKKAVQSALLAEGLYDSKIDGQYGPGTRKAISEWQKNSNFEPTGFLTIPQQSELIKNYLKPLFDNGIRIEKNILAGIKIPLPTNFRNPTEITPPFITYEAIPSSKIKVFLISQHGDDYDLKILFDAMQDLKIIPLDGRKLLLRNSFELSGKNDEFESFFTAISSNDKIKGFGLIWPAEEDFIAKRLLIKMRLEFESIPGALRGWSTANEDHNFNEYLGFELRRPKYSRSGLFIDDEARIITQSSGLSECSRLTANGTYDYSILEESSDLDLAVLTPQESLRPLSVIEYTSTLPKIGDKVALASFPYQGKLNRPTLSEGILRDMKDLQGDKNKFRFSINVVSGDSGGGIFDSSGNFIGLHISHPTSKENSDSQNAIKVREINEFLREIDTSGLKRSYRTKPVDPGQLEFMANKFTALINCWGNQ